MIRRPAFNSSWHETDPYLSVGNRIGVPEFYQRSGGERVGKRGRESPEVLKYVLIHKSGDVSVDNLGDFVLKLLGLRANRRNLCAA